MNGKTDTKRIDGLDVLKGFLIVLVLVGHFIRPPAKSGFVHYLIYSFHLPLLLAVSGYLLSEQSLGNVTFPTLLRKYLFRVGVPWAIAFLFFFLYEHREAILSGRLTAATVADALLYPWHHLWFIPAYVAMAVTTYILVKIRAPLVAVAVIALIFSVVWRGTMSDRIRDLACLYWLGDKRFGHLYCFFLIGFLMRNRFSRSFSTPELWLAAAALGVARIVLFFTPRPPALNAVSFVALNAVLALPVLSAVSRMRTLKLPPLNFIGKQSLGVYLWHPAVTIVCGVLVQRDYGLTAFYVSTAILSCTALVPGIAILSRIGFIDRWVLGNIRRPAKTFSETA